jgi:hypothetical protein
MWTYCVNFHVVGLPSASTMVPMCGTRQLDQAQLVSSVKLWRAWAKGLWDLVYVGRVSKLSVGGGGQAPPTSRVGEDYWEVCWRGSLRRWRLLVLVNK